MSDGTVSYEQQRATAARWMHDRRDRVGWWRWSVLTDHNRDDPESLRLPHRIAFLIFSDMVQRGLIVPVIADDGGDAFSINPGRDPEWNALLHPQRAAVRGHSLTAAGYIVSGIIGAVLAIVIERAFGK